MTGDGSPASSGIAATLREAEPGIKVRLVLDDGREVAGALRGVSNDAIDLEDGQRHQVHLREVKRVFLEFSSPPSE